MNPSPPTAGHPGPRQGDQGRTAVAVSVAVLRCCTATRFTSSAWPTTGRECWWHATGWKKE